MSPRRMDGFARPSVPAPVRPPAPYAAAQPQPLAPRPVAPVAAPQPTAQLQRPATSVAAPSPARPQQAASPGVPAKKSGGWKVVLQFVIGLAVIAGVAATIVWLYLKYYTA